MWLTTSGLSVGLAAITLAIFFVLAPDRLPKLVTLLIAAAGSALLFLAVEQRDALDRGLGNPAALREGGELELIIVLVCAGVALAHVGIGLLARFADRPRWLRPSREALTATALTALIVGGVIAIAAGVPGEISDRWEEFKNPAGRRDDRVPRHSAPEPERIGPLSVLAVGDRRQRVEAADRDRPRDVRVLVGSQHGSYAGFIRDAHSLYLETLGELGIVGFVLIVGFSLGVLGIGAFRCLRAPPDLRVGLAGAVAGCAAFVGGAIVDWTWEIGVFGVVFMTLAAIAVAGGQPPAARRGRAERTWERRAGIAGRVAVAVVSVAAIIAIVVPLAGSTAITESQQDAARGDLRDALAKADDAAAIEPFAATPYLQKALVLERLGRPEPAARAARRATGQGIDQLENLAGAVAARGRGREREGGGRRVPRGAVTNPRSRFFRQ